MGAFALLAGATTFWAVHFQETVIDQGHPDFHAAYTGTNSQKPGYESDTSLSSTLFAAAKLTDRTALRFDPEVSGGEGMSGVLGIAGFPNGETFRIGNPQPTVRVARAYVEQVVGSERQATLWAGKFSMTDFFDGNAYAHDARGQFFNWTLVDSGALDFAADTFGYTWGAAGEYRAGSWSWRAAAVEEPRQANQVQLDQNIARAHEFAAEIQRDLKSDAHPGALRLTVFFNQAHMGHYDEAVRLGQLTATTPDIKQTRAYRSKYGFASSDDLQLTDTLGGFVRLSANDGNNETWAYTEVDGSAAAGLQWTPSRIGRSADRAGLAEVVNLLWQPHRRYLEAGGLGFMLGDGGLDYGPEWVSEAYYRIQVNEWLQVTPDMQLVVNPGYNASRGPIPVWAIRAHIEF